jgi:hypothetical protein
MLQHYHLFVLPSSFFLLPSSLPSFHHLNATPVTITTDARNPSLTGVLSGQRTLRSTLTLPSLTMSFCGLSRLLPCSKSPESDAANAYYRSQTLSMYPLLNCHVFESLIRCSRQITSAPSTRISHNSASSPPPASSTSSRPLTADAK